MLTVANVHEEEARALRPRRSDQPIKKTTRKRSNGYKEAKPDKTKVDVGPQHPGLVEEAGYTDQRCTKHHHPEEIGESSATWGRGGGEAEMG